MSNLKVGDIVFYKGDEGIIREVMTDGKENFYRVDVSRKSILYLYEDELDLGTQKLNENQKVVLEWLKSETILTREAPILSVNAFSDKNLLGKLPNKVRKAYKLLDCKQEYEVLAAFAQWGLGQEEKE
ncbi:hypothetical protein HU255_02575 [Enterococcus hirae]|uniref:hypothetical protein n=1 Tax=Enterococcus TaxID=1350 RepID=UPI000A32D0D0|nr:MULTISPECIES: hypothetical protein [Enterococcus]EMF0297006.1 hypothetical protein [Enterococcus hirae]OTO54643.1 hypothetical protein A5813_000064 [Enterococcus faecium]OTO62261.1 hypothetical protein A5812_001176 [Enterococcus faecium]QKX66507.1 hypothetical protein HU262_06975 [Enterococcus hirae]QKX68060.1 hypothetical protein HU255_02575 [Enterococcus hirae]